MKRKGDHYIMFDRLSTDNFNWILITVVILFIIEIAFFGGEMIISALISAALIYFGWNNFTELWGKVIFWIGIVSIIIAVVNLLAIRFLIIVAIILFLIHYLKSKDNVDTIAPNLPPRQEVIVDPVIKVEPLFDHTIFKDQKTEETAYQWRDINIHAIYGERVIDLSNTVLPNDTVVISIRQIIGNMTIYVPYEVEVSIHHSSVFGRAHILGKHHEKLMNQSLFYQTTGYDGAKQRVKIITSVFSGDIEVKRI